MPRRQLDAADPFGSIVTHLAGDGIDRLLRIALVGNSHLQRQQADGEFDLAVHFVALDPSLLGVEPVEPDLLIPVHLIRQQGLGVPVGRVPAAVVEQVEQPIRVRDRREGEASWRR